MTTGEKFDLRPRQREARTEVADGALKRGALDPAEQAESEQLERDRVAWNLPTPKPAKLIDRASPFEANPS